MTAIKQRIVNIREICESPALRLDAGFYLNSMTIDPEVGDRIRYRGVWGRGPLQEATVIELGEKNGQALADLDDGHWAYLYQIESIICRAEVAADD